MADTSSLVRKVENRGGFIAQRLAMDVQAELKIAAAPHRKSGQMEGAIHTSFARLGPDRWRVTATVPVVQAATTDRGARPHVIVPRSGKVLRFSSGGNIVFARRVNHPGNKPYRWFSNVMDHATIRAILTRFVGR